jgi:hypothetical protein
MSNFNKITELVNKLECQVELLNKISAELDKAEMCEDKSIEFNNIRLLVNAGLVEIKKN